MLGDNFRGRRWIKEQADVHATPVHLLWDDFMNICEDRRKDADEERPSCGCYLTCTLVCGFPQKEAKIKTFLFCWVPVLSRRFDALQVHEQAL